MSTLLEANMEAQVCPNPAEQVRVHIAITMCASLWVRVADGLIATFEAINFVHFPYHKRYIQKSVLIIKLISFFVLKFDMVLSTNLGVD